MDLPIIYRKYSPRLNHEFSLLGVRSARFPPKVDGVVPRTQNVNLRIVYDRLRVGWLNEFGRGAARAEDAQGTPTQSHISPSILVYEENPAMSTCESTRVTQREDVN